MIRKPINITYFGEGELFPPKVIGDYTILTDTFELRDHLFKTGDKREIVSADDIELNLDKGVAICIWPVLGEYDVYSLTDGEWCFSTQDLSTARNYTPVKPYVVF